MGSNAPPVAGGRKGYHIYDVARRRCTAQDIGGRNRLRSSAQPTKSRHSASSTNEVSRSIGPPSSWYKESRPMASITTRKGRGPAKPHRAVTSRAKRLIDLGELRLCTKGLGHDRDGHLLLRVGRRHRSEPQCGNCRQHADLRFPNYRGKRLIEPNGHATKGSSQYIA